MTAEVQIVEPSAAAVACEGSTTGYVRDMVTYTVMDDLSVAPMSTICAVAALAVSDITGLQAKTVEIGYKEVIIYLEVMYAFWIAQRLVCSDLMQILTFSCMRFDP